MSSVLWALGRIGTRVEITTVLGGSPLSGGICPARKTSSVLLFSDPGVGEKRGYHDGWLEDDEDGPVFEYTGHGPGMQTFEGRGGANNRAVLHHVDDGRSLRLFKAIGKVPHTDTKLHRYIGMFELDKRRPYEVRQALNAEGVMRRVIVFRLRPVGDEFERREDDALRPTSRTKVTTVPAEVTTSSIIEPETNKKTKSSRSATPKTEVERREAMLSEDFLAYMDAHGRKLTRFQINPKGLASTLLTDLYDDRAHVLYELKGSSRREAIRMAIGQLFDYSRHVQPANPKLAVLVPDEPHEDLRELLAGLGIAVVWQDGDEFVGVPGLAS